jgi:uncharacterized protein YjbJ (UPF0337 family)
MAGRIEKAKGRVKEAVGALTSNERLKRSGQLDQVSGVVKEGAGKVKKKVKELGKK